MTMKEPSSWSGVGLGTYTTWRGEREIKFRRLTLSDVAHLPHHFPILNGALFYYYGSLDKPGKIEKAFIERYQTELEELSGSAEEIAEVITRACVEPRFYDHAKLNGATPPPDAVPLYALNQLDQGRLISAIIQLSSGVSEADALEEATKVARFPEKRSTADPDARRETKRTKAKRTARHRK